MMKRKNNFTLIELLVVIAIIAILAGMLLPSLGAAKNTAYTSICQNNMKQTALCIQQYQTDNDDFFIASKRTNHGHWAEMLRTGGYFQGMKGAVESFPSHTPSPEILACPAEKRTARGTLTVQFPLDDVSLSYDYGLNHCIHWSSETRGSGFTVNTPTRKTTQLRIPSQAAMMADTGRYYMYHTEGSANFKFRHKNSVSVLMQDYHAEMKKYGMIPMGSGAGEDQLGNPFWAYYGNSKWWR